MFKALEIGSTIDLDPRNLAALVRSTNTQELALGGGPKKATHAFVLSFFDASDNSYRVYVFLGRPERDRLGRPAGLLFRSEPKNVPFSAFEALQREAASMVQSQGFQMEPVEVGTLGAEARATLIAELPFDDTARVPPPPVSPEPPSSPPLALVTSQMKAAPVAEVSGEISLPESQAIAVLGRLLSLF